MWFVFALLGAVMAAISVTFTKAGLDKINPAIAFAIEAVLILIISWSTVLFQGDVGGEIGKMDKRAWLFILGAGVATTLSSLFQFTALKGGHVPAVSSIDRSSIIFTVLLASFFLKDKITWQSLVGAALIIAGAAFISLGKAKQ